MTSRTTRLLVLGPEPGDGRGPALCAAAPAGWQVTLLTPLPGQRPVATESVDGPLREIRLGVEIPREGRLGAAGIVGDAMLFGLAAAAARPGPLRRMAEALADAADLVLHLSPWSASLLAHPPAEIYAPRGMMLAEALAGLQGDRLGEAWEQVWRLEAALCGRARLVLAPDATAAAGLGLLHDLPPARLRDAAEGLRAGDAALPPPQPGGRRFCLAFNDYAIGAGHSGGSIRSRAMLDGLGRDTLLLTLGDQPAVTALAPRVLEVVVPRAPAQRVALADLRALAPAPVEDVLAAAHVAENAPLRHLLASLAPRAEALVFEHCYMAPLLPMLRRAAGPVPVIYHAHNIEAALKRGLLGLHPLAGITAEAAGDLERALAGAADLVLCCSEADAEALRAMSRAPVLMVPHDALLEAGPAASAPAGPPRIGFIGSPHPPNRDAALFIRDVLAPALPEAAFEIVGGVCDSLPPGGPPNLRLHGVLAPEAMRAVLGGWRIALNPVEHGGGSSVKLADYLAQGLPVVTTPHGARGSMIGATGAGILAGREAFVPLLGAMLAAPQRIDALAAAARAWWASPGRVAPLEATRAALDELLAAAAPPRPPRHLLVLGSAATEAEAALLAGTLDGLRPGFDTVDVLLPADLPPGLAAPLSAAATRSLRLPAAAPLPAAPEAARQMLVAREEAAILHGFLPDLAGAAPLGVSGLLAPDAAEGRGLAPFFSVLLPPGTGWVQLDLGTAVPLRLRLAVGAQAFRPLELAPPGQIVELEPRPGPPDAPLLLLGEVSGPATGLRLRRLVCGAAGGAIRAMPLDIDATHLVRGASPQAWLVAARAVAAQRSEAERDLLRGAPAPAALAPWLLENLGRYAAMLVPLEAGGLAAMLLGAPGPRRLGLTLAADAGASILPEAEASLLALTDRALLARPGPWPMARGGVLRGFAALRQETTSARHLAAARAALGLERPWLLAAHLSGAMPARQALHALTAAAGVDLVLAGDGQALRITPAGATRRAPVAFAALLCGAASACLGLWLPDPAADERALIALAWSAGVPVVADAGNPFARDALGAEAVGPARLLAEPGLRARLVLAGQARLAAWEEEHARWAD